MVMNVCFKNTFVRNLLNERMFKFSDICPNATSNSVCQALSRYIMWREAEIHFTCFFLGKPCIVKWIKGRLIE